MTASPTIVETDESGQRLDRWFKRRYPALNHSLLEKMLRTGQIRVDGKRAKAGDRLAEGQTLRVPPQIADLKGPITVPPSEDAGDKSFIEELVIHEDEAVFVLNKPSGLPTQGGSGIRRHVDGLLIGLQGKKRQKPKLVHRLDRDTSGVLVVARTQPAAAALAESLRRRDAHKIYWALTAGVPKPRRGTIDLALAKESGFGEHGRDERMTALDEDEAAGTEGAKFATTHYVVMATAADKYAFVALKPVTGRTHQLRAHLAAIGTPIVGDFKYGGAAAKGMGVLEDRLHLHARSIDIAHPDGGRLRVTAALAPHMEKSWRLFGFDENVHNPFTDQIRDEARGPARETAKPSKQPAASRAAMAYPPKPRGDKDRPQAKGKNGKPAPHRYAEKGAQRPRKPKREEGASAPAPMAYAASPNPFKRSERLQAEAAYLSREERAPKKPFNASYEQPRSSRNKSGKPNFDKSGFDKRAGGKPAFDKRGGDKPTFDKRGGGKPGFDKPRGGERPRQERTRDDASEKPQAKVWRGGHPSAKDLSGPGFKPRMVRPGPGRPGKPREERAYQEKSGAGGKSRAGAPRQDRQRTEGPRSEGPRSDKLRFDKPGFDKARAGKPNMGKPRDGKGASAKPRNSGFRGRGPGKPASGPRPGGQPRGKGR